MKTRIILIMSISIAMIFALGCATEGTNTASGDNSAESPQPESSPTEMNDGDKKMDEGENPMVGGAPMMKDKDIIDNAVNSKDHTTLVAAVKAADLVETLKGDGPFTVFAPTNEAFEKLPKGTVDTLLKPENKDKLKGILTYHVVAGKMDAAAVVEAIKNGNGKATLKTVQGEELTASMDGDKVIITDAKGGKSTVTIADVFQKNGVIHVIDTVLMPSK